MLLVGNGNIDAGCIESVAKDDYLEFECLG